MNTSSITRTTPIKLKRTRSQIGLRTPNISTCISKAEDIFRASSAEKSQVEQNLVRLKNFDLNESTERLNEKPQKLKEFQKFIKTKKSETHARILKFLMTKETTVENLDKQRKLVIKIKSQQIASNSMSFRGVRERNSVQNTLDASDIMKKKISFFPSWLQNREDFKACLLEKITNDKAEQNESENRWIIFNKSFDLRTDKEMILTFEWLKNNYFCASLPAAMVFELTKCLKPINFKDGDIICTQGEEGNSLYIIHKGEVQIFPRENIISEGEIDVIIGSLHVATCHTGEVMGRQALENSTPRNATLRAKGNIEVLQLYREDYKKGVQSFFHNERREIFYFLSKLPFFKEFMFSVIEKFSVRAFAQFFYKNDVLYDQGGVAETFYVIISGQICCQNFIELNKYNQWPCGLDRWKLIKIGKTMVHNTILKRGEFFGEEEMIENKPRSQKMIAEEDSLCLCLNKDDFFQIFSSKDIIKYQKNSKLKPKNCLDSIKLGIEKEEENNKHKRDTLITALKANSERSRNVELRPKSGASSTEFWGQKFEKDFKSYLKSQTVMKRFRAERVARKTAIKKNKEEIFAEQFFIVS